MEGLEGYTPACPMTLETLNNGEKVCLFQSSSDADLAAGFDAGLETNYPDDVKWAGLNTAQQSALKRLFGWIRSCVPANATADDLGTFVSEKFKTEAGQYFDMAHLLTYYVHTDYFASVDQRAKNILLRTWDGLVWYTTYYDATRSLPKGTTVSLPTTTRSTVTRGTRKPGNTPSRVARAGFGTLCWPTFRTN